MKTRIVIGLGYGDEGKGLTTDYLCSQHPDAVVIRFNGGHQAGHTVVTADGRRHVFSSLGSGSFRGVPTYWSRYCTFYPPGFTAEWKALAQTQAMPRYYLDSQNMITTFYDVVFNRAQEQSRDPHGSCGLGFGATVERHESGCPVVAADLLQNDRLVQKLNEVAAYYQNKIARLGNRLLSTVYESYDFSKLRANFLQAAGESLAWIGVTEEAGFFSTMLQKDRPLVFEGAQGILLDMDHGFFPHVTRSHTTSGNAMQLVRKYALPAPEIYYVSRCYQTRHGAGPMTNESLPLQLLHTEQETNVYNQWQNRFRRSVLDIDRLHYALQSDESSSTGCLKHLVLTCLDQIPGKIPATLAGSLDYYAPEELASLVLPPAAGVLLSSSPCADRLACSKLEPV